MATLVDISGIDRTQLLYGLWCRACPEMTEDTILAASTDAVWDNERAAWVMSGRGIDMYFVDCFCQRSIKTDFSGDLVNAYAYDTEWGKGAFAAVVAAIRHKG